MTVCSELCFTQKSCTCQPGVQSALDARTLLRCGGRGREVAQLEDVGRDGVRAGHKEGVDALPVPPQLLARQRALRRLLQDARKP